MNKLICCPILAYFFSFFSICRFNSTGTLLISSSLDKTIKIWNQQGSCLKTLSAHTRYVNCLAVNSDSTVIASGSNDRSVALWDLTENLTLDSHITGIRSLLFTLASKTADTPLEYICPITHEIMRDPVYAEGKVRLVLGLTAPVLGGAAALFDKYFASD